MFQNIFRGKRVLVTGHTGFKGAWLSHWLNALGAEVCGYSIDVPTKTSLYELTGLKKKIRDLKRDVRIFEDVKRVFEEFKPEIVFHLAAQALVRPSYDDPVGTFSTNVMGSVHLLEAARLQSSTKVLIHVTSDKCYENVEKHEGYKETDPMGGKDPYSASKGACELVFSAYARSFFKQDGACRVGTVRAGNVIGGGDFAVDRIIPDCVRAWKQGEKVTIRSPKSTRPWQHVLEPLSGYMWLAAKLWTTPSLQGEGFNFGPSQDLYRSVEDLLNELTKSWPEGKWTIDASQIGQKKEAVLLTLNCEKAEKVLKWKSLLNFSESAQWTAQWYQSWMQGKDVLKITADQIELYSKLARERGLPWATSA